MKFEAHYGNTRFFVEVSSEKAFKSVKENGAYYHKRCKTLVTKPSCGGSSLQRVVAEAYGIELGDRNILRGRIDPPSEGIVIDMTEKTLRHAFDI